MTRDRVNLGSLLQFKLRVPPLKEQEAIISAMHAIDDRRAAEVATAAKLRRLTVALTAELLTRRVRPWIDTGDSLLTIGAGA